VAGSTSLPPHADKSKASVTMSRLIWSFFIFTMYSALSFMV